MYKMFFDSLPWHSHGIKLKYFGEIRSPCTRASSMRWTTTNIVWLIGGLTRHKGVLCWTRCVRGTSIFGGSGAPRYAFAVEWHLQHRVALKFGRRRLTPPANSSTTGSSSTSETHNRSSFNQCFAAYICFLCFVVFCYMQCETTE